jgi:hypothetical protein
MMDQRTSGHDTGLAAEFENDVVRLLMDAMHAMGTSARQERADLGTESVLSALVSGDSAAGAAIAPGVRAAGSLAGAIGCRGSSVWVSEDAGDGRPEAPEDQRELDALWREVRHEQAKRQRRKQRKSDQASPTVELPSMTGALRNCLHRALELAREEGTLSVRVSHVARALLELPDTRAREALVLEKLDARAASAALQRLGDGGEAPESASVLLLRTAGTFGKSGNPLTRKMTAWILGGGAGFGSAVVSAVRAETTRVTVRRGQPRTRAVDTLLGILALERALTVSGRVLPQKLHEANGGAELLRRYGARQTALARALLPATGVEGGEPAVVRGPADFERRLLHVAQLTASHQGSPTVGTTHLLAALLDKAGTDAESGAEIERVLTESGVDVEGLRAEPVLQVPGGSASTSGSASASAG